MGDLQEVLKRLGWDDGFQIPIANAENKALEEQLAKLSLRKAKSKSTLERATSRLDALKEHFKYIHQENEQNQKLISAHRQQYETMDHQYHLTKAEKENVELDIKQTTKQLKDSVGRELQKKDILQKGIAKAEKIKSETEWDTEALRAWEEALKKRDDDNELIKKFSAQDEMKYNELEARRILLQAEHEKVKSAVAKMVSQLHNYEMVIDRTGKVIKQQVTERDALIGQWKETVKMLQTRDDDIMKAQEQIMMTQELVEKQREKLDEESAFLLQEQKNNREIELEIGNMTMVNSKMRIEFNELTNHMLHLNSELQTLRREVASAGQNLENERIKGKLLTQTTYSNEILCVKAQEELEKLELKLDEMRNASLSSAERIKKIEMLIDAEEKRYNIYVMDTEKINTVMYRYDQTLKEQKAIGKTLDVDINNSTLYCGQLRKHIRYEKKELEKIQEVVYNMEFHIDEFEERLRKMQEGLREDAHSEEKEAHIQELEKVLADHKEVRHTLQNQLDRLRDEMHRLTNAIALDKEQLELLQDKCEQHLLVNEISKKHIAAAKACTQEKHVEENMMLLRLNQIEKDMKKEEKQIYTMEKLRLNLDQAMRERQLEINAQKLILQAKRRNLDEDKGRLRSDIALRQLKIDQVQKKYHIVLMALGKDEDGQPLSVTSIKIKNAQEKFMLQQEGDELDQKVKTAEKEIIAMENTLRLVNLTNCAFKNSLAPVKDEDDEMEEMATLEQQMRETNELLKEHKRHLAAKQAEMDCIQCCSKELEGTRDQLKESTSNLEQEFEMVEKQELDKAAKLDRADCQLKRVMKKVSKANVSHYERDLEIRSMRDSNKNVLQRLIEMSMSYQEMAPLINRYALEQNITLPEKKYPPSTSSSSLSSLSRCPSKNRLTNTARSDNSQGSNNILSKVDLSLNF